MSTDKEEPPRYFPYVPGKPDRTELQYRASESLADYTLEMNRMARVYEDNIGSLTYNLYTPQPPIIISSTVDLGTPRVRANHINTALDLCIEQGQLHKRNAPIPLPTYDRGIIF